MVSTSIRICSLVQEAYNVLTPMTEKSMADWFRFPLATLAAVALTAIGAGQERPLRLQGGMPGGLRTSVTESWGTLRFTVINENAGPREARVLVLYSGHEDMQF